MRLRALVFFLISVPFILSAQARRLDSILTSRTDYATCILKLRDGFTEQELLSAVNEYRENAFAKVKLYNALCWKSFNSDPQKALEYAQQQMAFALEVNDRDGLETGYDNYGFLYKNTGDFEKSISNFLKSLKIKEEKNDSAGISTCLNGIGGLYYKMERYPEALSYMMRTYRLDSAICNTDNVIIHYGNIGVCYANMGQYDKALRFYLLAERGADSLGLKQTATNLMNIGTAYLKKGDFDKAGAYFLRSQKSAEEQKDVGDITQVKIQLSELETRKHNYEQAIRYGEEAVTLAEKNDLNDVLMLANANLANVYSLMGNYQKAYQYQKRYSTVRDTVLSESNSRFIAEMQTKYETDKKEKQNQIYKQTIDLQDLNANRQQIIIYAVSALAVLLISLAFFIYRGYDQKKKANLELSEKNLIIEEKSRIVEEKNKDITDSIRYAKRLQEAILKPVRELPAVFPQSFIYFQPKDIVSGDFYWFERFGHLSMIAAADCTGHGVPGAFMSIIGCNLMSQAVNEYALTKPAVILNSLNKGLSKILHQRMDESSVKDGMDIALCAVDMKKMTLEFAGAFNPLWLVRGGKVIEYPADKFPVGAFLGEEMRMFNNHEVPLQKGDTIYLFSDGYADQFGGPKGKKFKYKQLKELLLSINGRAMDEQREILRRRLEEWKGRLEQVDDILVIGIKV